MDYYTFEKPEFEVEPELNADEFEQISKEELLSESEVESVPKRIQDIISGLEIYGKIKVIHPSEYFLISGAQNTEYL